MNVPPAITKAATLALINDLRAARSEEEKQRIERLLVEGNLRFCVYQARSYRRPGLELEDLIAVASAALVDAIRRFDPTKSVHFAAYARRCIRRDLATMVRRQASPIRLPREARRGEQKNGRETVSEPVVLSLHDRPCDLPGWRRGDDFAANQIIDAATENHEESLNSGIDAERIAALIGSLPDREASIVRMRFGLDGIAPHELAEIGAVLNLSKQRVQVILDKALASLRTTLKEAA